MRPPGEAGLEHGERHAGRLARAGRRLQHGAARLAQGVDQGGQDGVDRQVRHVRAYAGSGAERQVYRL